MCSRQFKAAKMDTTPPHKKGALCFGTQTRVKGQPKCFWFLPDVPIRSKKDTSLKDNNWDADGVGRFVEGTRSEKA